MNIYRFIKEKKELLNESTDFLTLIQTLQHLNKNSALHYRSSKDYSVDIDTFFKTIWNEKNFYTAHLQSHLGYNAADAELDFDETWRFVQNRSPSENHYSALHFMPQKFIALYGSWSSPLFRFVNLALPALVQQCSVLLFCEPEVSAIYSLFAESLSSADLGRNRIAVLPITDKDVLSALLEHPTVAGVEGQFQLYQASLYRQRVLSQDKLYSLHFGARNAVVFLNDCDENQILKLLPQCLQFHRRSEIRFNRWFVQEKVYPDVINWIENYFKENSSSSFGSAKVNSYRNQLTQQNEELARTKHWLFPFSTETANICTDFSNCSPLHQAEMLGPLITLTRFKNSAEATKFVNTTPYSNATVVVTESNEKYLETASQQRTPFVFKNTLPDPLDMALSSGNRHCSLVTSPAVHTQNRTIVY